MKPAEEPHPMVAGGKDVLEEASHQFVGRQILLVSLAGGAVAVRPAHASIGEQFQAAIAGGGFENVAAQILERLPARAHRLGMHHPSLFPDFARQAAQGIWMMLLEGLVKEVAKVVAQGIDRQEESFFGWHPLALVQAQPAAGYQVMNVRMINE